MMIRPSAFANALALTTAALALLLMVLRTASPSIFTFIFNAQFFGADVASLLPPHTDIITTISELAAFIGGAWVFGLIGALLYNRFIQEHPS